MLSNGVNKHLVLQVITLLNPAAQPTPVQIQLVIPKACSLTGRSCKLYQNKAVVALLRLPSFISALRPKCSVFSGCTMYVGFGLFFYRLFLVLFALLLFET